MELIKNIFFKKISDLDYDFESKEYHGCDFKTDGLLIKYRKAKITPKKTGGFVALWKRDSEGKTIPYDISDMFDFYFIEMEDENKKGIFVFPKSILIQNKILSSDKEGKRGFRLYPSWCKNLNSTAQKTQHWQLPFFVDLNQSESQIENQLKNLIQL